MLDLLILYTAEPDARAPQTPDEWRLIGALVLVGLAVAACFCRPPVRNIRFLEQRKSNRGDSGRALLDRMASPGGLPLGNTMGLSLRGQDLREEDLKNAFLADVDLSDTDLRGVDLSGANLDGAHLLGARYDEHTRWPAGLEPEKHGAVLAP